MKKIVIAAAIVCTAVFAHAANCTWSTYAYDSSMATDLTGGTYWLVALGSSADALDSITVASDGTINLGSASQIETGTVSAGTYGAIGGSITGLSSSDNGSYYGVIVWDGASDGYYGKSAGMVSGIVDTPPTDADPIAFDNSGLGYGATLANEAVVPIPEPTSGLLMVFGMAGLALRRRRA